MTSTAYTASQGCISQPHAHDVLSGRGAGITKHPGNKRWRELIHNNREKYTSLPRNQRPLIAEQIVKAVRSLNPPGRFLSKDVNTQLWYEIGDDKAAEKTAQAMRDSKKTGKDQSPSSSPVTAKVTVPTPWVASSQCASPIPVFASDATCTPTLGRPSLKRLTTDDTFTQRMEGFAFMPPIIERDVSTILMDVGESTHHTMMTGPSVQCSPDLQKPDIARASTFDRHIAQCTFTVPSRPPFAREESGLSFASFGMLEEEEFDMLEASCETPSAETQIPAMTQQNWSFTNANTHNNTNFNAMNQTLHSSDHFVSYDMEPLHIADDMDIMMMMDDSAHHYNTRRINRNSSPFHYSI
ncbi:Nitrilase family, member 2 [Seminavis robusta]|uniref:Nitrilase family, member 2 n=1 Tax=Seminavis robusta TaxID=568900 RepID=A0A9N8EK85_9STRA|nr:Nitrilase family, member 2 [Seminavis robusta]|eukprot:Sro1213_g252950.1 Nitrilase family, member 2 (354) ;mRNA; r:3523-4584